MMEGQIVPLLVRDIICEWLALRHAQVIPEARFVEDFGGDEIDMMSILTDLEDAYKRQGRPLKIMPIDFKKIQTVSDLLGILREKGVI